MTEGATGLWKASDSMEASAASLLTPLLEPLRPLVRDAYEAGVEALTIPSKEKVERDWEAAIFLRRALVDLRAMWLLLTRGYSSPAASVTASLWEHALTVVALLSEEGKGRSIPSTGDAPWSPIELADFLGRERGDARPANAYAAYKWLCKVKHPTLRSGVYDSGASVSGGDSFVVMSAPDVRQEDAAVKRTIIMIALARITSAAEAFVEAREPKRDSAEYVLFRSRIDRVNSDAANHIGSDPLPFQLLQSEMPKKFR